MMTLLFSGLFRTDPAGFGHRGRRYRSLARPRPTCRYCPPPELLAPLLKRSSHAGICETVHPARHIDPQRLWEEYAKPSNASIHSG